MAIRLGDLRMPEVAKAALLVTSPWRPNKAEQQYMLIFFVFQFFTPNQIYVNKVNSCTFM